MQHKNYLINNNYILKIKKRKIVMIQIKKNINLSKN